MLDNRPMNVLNMRYEKLCDLNSNSQYRVMNVVETFNIGEVNELTFKFPTKSPKWKYLTNENLILFNGEYYRIKTPVLSHSAEQGSFVSVTCRHLSETLQTTVVSMAEVTPRTATELLKIALCYNDSGEPTLGWSVGKVTVDSKVKRGLESSEQSAFANILNIAEKFNGFPIFHSDTLTVDILAKSSDESTPILDLSTAKDLKSINITYDTSEMITRLYCFGAEDDNGNELTVMSVNPTGKAYIDNYDYFYSLGYTDDDIQAHPELFIKTNIWRDSNYYEAQDLYNDGQTELARVAKPKITINIEALDMRKFTMFRTINLGLGDCVRAIDDELNLAFVCNVTGRVIDYDNPHILNITITDEIDYRNVLSELFTSVSTMNQVVTSGGVIHGSAVDKIPVEKVKDIDAYYVQTAYLEANYITSDDIRTEFLTADQAAIKYLTAESAEIIKLDVRNANIELANINSLLAGNIGAGTVQTIHLTANNATIDEAFIKDIIAAKITVADLLTHSATAEEIVLISQGGKPSIAFKGSTQQFYDNNGNVRVQIGQDSEGEFNFIVRGSDGTTALFDETGIKPDGVPDGLIVNNMIANETIGKDKLNFPIVETDENGKVSITEILDGNGDSFGIKYTEFQETIQKDMSVLDKKIENIEAGVSTSITSVDVFYYLSSSATELLDGEWLTDAPEWVDGKYYWQKTITSFTDGSSTETTPVCISGGRGVDGENAQSVRIDSSGGYILKDGDSVTLTARIYEGTTEIDPDGEFNYTWYRSLDEDAYELFAVGKTISVNESMYNTIMDIYFVCDGDEVTGASPIVGTAIVGMAIVG